MDILGIKAKVWYGKNDIAELKKALEKKYCVWYEANGQMLMIRPWTPYNEKLMKEEEILTEAERVKQEGRL